MARRGRPRHPDILTPREWDVLALLREAATNEQIGARLGITERTAKFHVSEILSKLGVSSREEAAAWQPEVRRASWLAAGAPLAHIWRRSAGSALKALEIAIGTALVAGVAAGIALLALMLTRNGGDGGTPAVASGERIAFSFQGSIYIVRPDGSDLSSNLQTSEGVEYSAPELSPDGQRIAFIINNRRVLVAPADFGFIPTDVDLFVDRPPAPGGASNFSMGPVAVHWSPDSEQLLVTRQRLGGSGVSDVVLMDKDGGNQKTLLQSGMFIEATWTQPGPAPSGPQPIGGTRETQKIIVVGADGSLKTATYDLAGKLYAYALPSPAMRPAVAALPRPLTDSTMVRSTQGSPEPFGPIELYAPDKDPFITAGGCGATWSPNGDRIAYYDGFGIAIKTPDASPEDRQLIVTNEQLGLQNSEQARTDVCAGLSISWAADAAWYDGGDGGVKFSYPRTWVEGAAPMPYASCACIVVGPQRAEPPYGVAVFSADLDLSGGCPISAWFGIRVGFDSEPRSLNLSGYDACQQSMHHQPPVGLTNETGETRVYRELTTFIDARDTSYFVIAFYRDGDAVGERETLAAYDDLLAGFRYLGKPAEEPCVETTPGATPRCGTPIDYTPPAGAAS